jgi:hypothetical protein
MFEQYNNIEKIMRVVIFTLVTYFALMYIPNDEIVFEDKIKVTIVITILFLVYDMYFPSVRIEQKQ